MRTKRKVISYEGSKYLLIEDPALIQERKERRGYSKGRTDGESYAAWKPPVSKDTPLPNINYDKLGKLYDRPAYYQGFSDGYYARV